MTPEQHDPRAKRTNPAGETYVPPGDERDPIPNYRVEKAEARAEQLEAERSPRLKLAEEDLLACQEEIEDTWFAITGSEGETDGLAAAAQRLRERAEQAEAERDVNDEALSAAVDERDQVRRNWETSEARVVARAEHAEAELTAQAKRNVAAYEARAEQERRAEQAEAERDELRQDNADLLNDAAFNVWSRRVAVKRVGAGTEQEGERLRAVAEASLATLRRQVAEHVEWCEARREQAYEEQARTTPGSAYEHYLSGRRIGLYDAGRDARQIIEGGE